MGSHIQIQAQNHFYTVTPDSTDEYFALITGAALDEITGLPPAGLIVQTPWLQVQVRTTEDGLFALAGYVERAFLHHSTTGYIVPLTVGAPGYRSAALTVPVPANALFPIVVLVTKLRPLPVRVQGRVVQDTVLRQPIPGARVRLVDDPLVAPTDHTLALRTPLGFAHAAGVTVRARQLNPSGGARTLAAPALSGDAALTLNDRTGLAAGSILRLGAGPSLEFGLIQSLAPTPANPALPGQATLHSPLAHSFAANTVVQPVTAGLAGASVTLTKPADAGAGLVLVNNAFDADTVEIADPLPDQVEYRAIGALTDANGFYVLAGMGQVATLFLEAAATGFQPLPAPIPLTVVYGPLASSIPLSGNAVNFRLTP